MKKILIYLSFLLLFTSCDLSPTSAEDDTVSYDESDTLTDVDIRLVEDSIGMQLGEQNFATRYITRVKSGEDISLTVPENADIWYLFTCTSKNNANPPSLSSNSILSSIMSENSPKTNFSKSNLYTKNSEGHVNFKHIDLPFELPCATKKTDAETQEEEEDNIGVIKYFYDVLRDDDSQLFPAKCVEMRTVGTKLGDRTLVVYLEEGLNSKILPSQSQITLMADLFLRDGYDNDIFDKVTSLYGDDWKYFNADYLSQFANRSRYGNANEKLISKNDTITILLCDIENHSSSNQNSSSFTAAYYYDANYFKKDAFSNLKSNARAMITVQVSSIADKDKLNDGIVSVAHEFQHLVHSQYYDEYISGFGKEISYEYSDSMTECFSVASEELLSYYLYNQAKSSSLTSSNQAYISDPFDVGRYGGENGYISTNYPGVVTSGYISSYLLNMNKINLMDWRNDSLAYYGAVGAFGHYILVNYGAKILKTYKNNNVADIKGIVDAINYYYPSAKMTRAKLLANWGTAMLLSSKPNFNSPFAYNKRGWYIITDTEVGDIRIPSVNMNVYNWYFSDNSIGTGIPSFNISKIARIYNNGMVPVKMSTASAGSTYTAKAPVMEEGVVLTVIAVPK